MLVTEKEAAELWCPLVRWKFSTTSDQPASNRETSTTIEEGMNHWAFKGTRCIGSRCMAWRTASYPLQWEGEKVRITIPDTRPPVGYCGAFGKAEP